MGLLNDLSYFQLDSLGHVLTRHVPTCGHLNTQSTLFGNTLKFFTSNYKEVRKTGITVESEHWTPEKWIFANSSMKLDFYGPNSELRFWDIVVTPVFGSMNDTFSMFVDVN